MTENNIDTFEQPEQYYTYPLSEGLIDTLAIKVVEIEKEMIDRQLKVRPVIDQIDTLIRDAVRKEIEENKE